MSTTKARAGLALIIVAVIAGCGSDSSTAPRSNTLDLGPVLT